MVRAWLVLAILLWPIVARLSADECMTGEALPGMAGFDSMMAAFMERHQVPGAALAVTDQGRLVYARGFGYDGPRPCAHAPRTDTTDM